MKYIKKLHALVDDLGLTELDAWLYITFWAALIAAGMVITLKL
tara:strand:+ start:345 stop:473 length:129 start_codon:yes stop_codon:yes gene_type:complete